MDASSSSQSHLPSSSFSIAHVALWTQDLERLRGFYVSTFGCQHGAKYTNPKTGFSSYFLTFDAGPRLEIMSRADVQNQATRTPSSGFVHIALALGSEVRVRETTERFRALGIPVHSEPRRTGDGYYESVIADPDGNLIELTV